MITYTIGGSGGPICRGIPSLDVAISILSDMVRYEVSDDDENVRTALEVTLDYVDERPKKYWQVADEDGRPDLVISEEPRCGHCHQIIQHPILKGNPKP
jgi:hypothetical protein